MSTFDILREPIATICFMYVGFDINSVYKRIETYCQVWKGPLLIVGELSNLLKFTFLRPCNLFTYLIGYLYDYSLL